MIRGEDFVASRLVSVDEFEPVIWEFWKSLYVEEDPDQDCIHYYEDAESYRVWNDEGWTEEYGPKLITYYFSDPTSCTMEREETDPLRRKLEDLFGFTTEQHSGSK